MVEGADGRRDGGDGIDQVERFPENPTSSVVSEEAAIFDVLIHWNWSCHQVSYWSKESVGLVGRRYTGETFSGERIERFPLLKVVRREVDSHL